MLPDLAAYDDAMLVAIIQDARALLRERVDKRREADEALLAQAAIATHNSATSKRTKRASKAGAK
jgi:hypothetical protein